MMNAPAANYEAAQQSLGEMPLIEKSEADVRGCLKDLSSDVKKLQSGIQQTGVSGSAVDLCVRDILGFTGNADTTLSTVKNWLMESLKNGFNDEGERNGVVSKILSLSLPQTLLQAVRSFNGGKVNCALLTDNVACLVHQCCQGTRQDQWLVTCYFLSR